MTDYASADAEKAVAIDFETFYDKEFSLKKMSTWNYVFHPRFDAYLVSVYSDNPEIRYVGHPKDFDWSQIDDCIWTMHNASFDGLVCKRLVGDGIIPDTVKPIRLFCTADLAAYLKTNRNLAQASEFLLGLKVDKSTRAAMLGKEVGAIDEELKAKLLEYAMSDAQLCYQLWSKFHKVWPAVEQRMSELNREAGWYGMAFDRESVEAAYQSLTAQRWEAENALPWVKEGAPPLSVKSIFEQGRRDGIPVPASFAKTNPDAMIWEDEYKDRFPWVAAIRTYRRTNALYKKVCTLREGLREDSTYPYQCKYFGAATGRMSGGGSDSGGKLNIQNMPKEEMFEVHFRNLLVPRKGHKLVVADYAQIEARILLWRAGDQATLDLIRTGISVYEAHARATMGWTGGPLKKEDPKLYALAKARCASGDTLVLTDSGYKPIIKVTLSDRVWDGLEYVTHSGVVCSGFKPTVPVFGDLFTGEHELFYTDTDKIKSRDFSAGEPARELARFRSACASRHEVWELACAVAHVLADLGSKAKAICSLCLRLMRNRALGCLAKSDHRKDNPVCQVCQQENPAASRSSALGEGS